MDAKTVYVALVMVSIWGRKMTLADKTVYPYGSVDTNFDPPWFSLDSTFKETNAQFLISKQAFFR